MSDLFKSRDWPEWQRQAARLVEGFDSLETLAAMPHVYDDTGNTGHLYWWAGDIVAAAPVNNDGSVDTANIGAAGDEDGAELDLYGRECLIGAKLATRFGDMDAATEYKRLAKSLFAEAERTGYMNWSLEDRPPV